MYPEFPKSSQIPSWNFTLKMTLVFNQENSEKGSK